ncbi:MAG: endonuclease/exonuclease/phosphatase [Lachnospiraceae bacterium]|nr:endonuclease/exonuclease/phosphatase [Lachnospiraceae bacterium]
MRVCFWNTNKNMSINSFIVDIVYENNIDILILAEYVDNINRLQLGLSEYGIELEEGITVGCERIVILTRRYEIEPGFQNKYCSMQIIDNKYILVCLHLPSKLFANPYKRSIAIGRIVEEIQKYENCLRTEKAILVGDINENPYESGCLGADRFHAIPIYNDTKRLYRIVMEEKFKMFYNPMWNLLGDFSFPPGTYYYAGNDVINSFWNIYDQVMIRPCLREYFVDGELRILYKTEKKKLIDSNGHPSKGISDHLPIMFEIREEER